jgi:phosphopantetheinyl transferase
VILEPVCLVVAGEQVPQVYLFDATNTELTEAELRSQVRALCSAGHQGYSSRSYRFPLSVAALHDTPVGIDMERISAWQRRTVESVLTPQERSRHPKLSDEEASAIWSSKEALAKSLGQPVNYDPRRLNAPISWPEGRSGQWQASSLAVPHGHVGWLCWQIPTAADRTG